MMRNYILILLSLIICSCKVTKHMEQEMDYRHVFEADQITTLVESDTSIESTAELTLSTITEQMDITIEEIEYDTSVTDSTGNHPVLKTKKTHIGKNVQKNEENDLKTTKNDLKTTESVIFEHKNDSTAFNHNTENNKEVKSKNSFCIRIFFVAMLIGIFFLSMLHRKKR